MIFGAERPSSRATLLLKVSSTVSLLDRRVVTQRYGKAILNALPPFRREIA